MRINALAVRYALFSVFATLANLAVQRAVLSFGDCSILLGLAIFTGTAIGLVLKYFLDKRWIFEDFSNSAKEHRKKFVLYTAMGIVTTAIFWGVESALWFLWQTQTMRELGAVIGLSIGYAVKYELDRRFVFKDGYLENST